jgi:hypothetical protein
VKEIKAIPAKYQGITFRSRTEARWAVLFQALGVEWRYEHEGFQLPSGWYVPDFWLPKVDWKGTWVEIKGAAPTGNERRLCAELADATDCGVLLFGDVDSEGILFIPRSEQRDGAGIGYRPERCRDCGRFCFEQENNEWCKEHVEFAHRYGGPFGRRDMPDLCVEQSLETARAHNFWNPRGARH